MERRRLVGFTVILVAVAIGGWMLRRSGASAQEAAESETFRKNIELTVYSQDFGMVREIRPLKLAAGDNRLQIQDVSRLMDPRSVLLDLSGATGAEIIAHSYDLGVSEGAGLLKRYLGKQVELVRYADNGREAERQTGRLMVNGDGGVLLQEEGKFYVNPPGTVVAPAAKEIVTIPQLTVQAHAPTGSPVDVSLAYLTRGLHWNADYVATLDPKTDRISMECWATVTNRTGADYANAAVTLVAGSPNRAVDYVEADARMPAALPGYSGRYVPIRRKTLAPESVGEGHQYRISVPTDVVQEQMNRLLMLSSEQVKVKKDYSTRLPNLYGYSYYAESSPQRGAVTLAISFRNEKALGLGDPLPNGSMRLYEPDKRGSLRYAGADGVQDTPKDGKVSLTLSNAFDLYTERRVIRNEKAGRRRIRRTVEVVVHNEKQADQTVRVVQGFGGGWKMVAETAEHHRTDAYTAQWKIPVKAGAQSRLQFTVELSI